MTAHKVPLHIYKGATFDRSFIWASGPRGAAKPVDLAGCTARAQVRAADNDGPLLVEFSTQDGSIELGGASGRIRLRLSAAQTAAIEYRPGDVGVYDLPITFPDGTVIVRMAGPVYVKAGPTHA